MLYADYEYYTTVFKGEMPEEDFVRLSRQASAYIDAVTFRRAKAAFEGLNRSNIKDACCAVADAYLLNEQGGGIAAENNDGLSVNYVAGISNAKTDDQRLYSAAILYLGTSGLMCRRW